MVDQIRKGGYLTAVALLCFAAGAFAQDRALAKKSANTKKGLISSLAPATAQFVPGGKATSPGEISQKLVVMAPESPWPMILASDLLGLAALIFVSHRRKVWVKN